MPTATLYGQLDPNQFTTSANALRRVIPARKTLLVADPTGPAPAYYPAWYLRQFAHIHAGEQIALSHTATGILATIVRPGYFAAILIQPYPKPETFEESRRLALILTPPLASFTPPPATGPARQLSLW